jgi:hypothetical protein
MNYPHATQKQARNAVKFHPYTPVRRTKTIGDGTGKPLQRSARSCRRNRPIHLCPSTAPGRRNRLGRRYRVGVGDCGQGVQRLRQRHQRIYLASCPNGNGQGSTFNSNREADAGGVGTYPCGPDWADQACRRRLALGEGFIGASDFSSAPAPAPALQRKLAKQISFLSIINEFGELLGLLFDKPNMNMRTLRKMIVQLYEKSKRGNSLGAAAYSDIEKDIAELLSPALSILAESVPGSVYGSVDESAVTSGFLTRFLFIEYNCKRPPLNENCGNVEPSAGLV